MKAFLIFLVRCYQLFLSPFLRTMTGGHGCCRHEPTCSRYAIEAIRIHGAFYGVWLAIVRLSRCHPWGTYGYDPVPKPRSTPSEFSP